MINLDDIPQVAFHEMNIVHDEEATILNTLEALITNSPNDIEAIASCLHELIEHTREHFSNELRLMNEVGFPAKFMHENEHIRVFNDMQREMATWLSTKNNDILKDYFLGSMQEWLRTHIMTMDTMTAQFIANVKG